MRRMLFKILAASALLAAPTHAQDLILNGSFESPTIAANTSSLTTPTSWSGTQVSIISGDYSPGYPLPHDGQQYALLGASSVLSQTFTISSPGTYFLKWFDSTEFNGPAAQALYSVTVADGAANTVASANLDANATALRLWTQRSIELALAPDTYTLRFQGNAPEFGEKPLIDSVSVVVPEPSTMSLTVAALLGFFAQKRRPKGELVISGSPRALGRV
jgi:hypothetical protein